MNCKTCGKPLWPRLIIEKDGCKEQHMVCLNGNCAERNKEQAVIGAEEKPKAKRTKKNEDIS